AAANQYHELSIAATLAIGGDAGVGVGVGVRVLNLNTDAYIDSTAAVRAAKDVSVTATGKSAVIGVVAGASGGEVGVAGTIGVTVMNTHTFAFAGNTGTLPPAWSSASAYAKGDKVSYFGHAYESLDAHGPSGTNPSVSSEWVLDDGPTVVAGNNVIITSSDETKLLLVTASLAGGYVGVGVAVGVVTLSKDTEPFVGVNSSVDALASSTPQPSLYDGTFTSGGDFHTASIGGVAIEASSKENLFALAASAGAGFVGVAGGIGVTLLHVITSAFAGNGAQINQLGTLSSSQSVTVVATDDFRSLTISGGIAGGFVGVAAGVDIGV